MPLLVGTGARSRASFPVPHAIRVDRDWYPGMMGRSLCGVYCHVKERAADPSREQLCQRCEAAMSTLATEV